MTALLFVDRTQPVDQKVENRGVQRPDELHAGSVDFKPAYCRFEAFQAFEFEPNLFLELRRFDELELAPFY